MQEHLARAMGEASAAMEFERAAALRDRIRALTNVQASQGVNPEGVEEADVVALHQEAGQACVEVFFIRANQNWGNRAYFPRTGAGADPAEILEAFLGQFYGNKTPARQILLSDAIENADLMEEALSRSLGRKVAIAVPRRGEKAALVGHAARNAREALARRMAESASQIALLEGLAGTFGLDAPPDRIEVYDNSHIMGAHAVGAMIVAGPDGMVKSQYRKFNIRSAGLTPGDDFAMMHEVLTRRFSRLVKEDPDRQGGTWPDLVLIDGGAGQVSAADRALAELGVDDVAVIGVAKGVDRDAGKEEFHRSEPAAARAGTQGSRALFHPAPARRGPPLRNRRASDPARRPDPGDAPRRGSGRRRCPQAGAAGTFRLGQGRGAGGPRRSAGGARNIECSRRDDLRLLPWRRLRE